MNDLFKLPVICENKKQNPLFWLLMKLLYLILFVVLLIVYFLYYWEVLTQKYLFICTLVLFEINLEGRNTLCEIQLGLFPECKICLCVIYSLKLEYVNACLRILKHHGQKQKLYFAYLDSAIY